MEALSLVEEPEEPAVCAELGDVVKGAGLVYFGVVCELCALDEGEDDGVLEAGEDGADAVEGERVLCEHVVGLHCGCGSGRARAHAGFEGRQRPMERASCDTRRGRHRRSASASPRPSAVARFGASGRTLRCPFPSPASMSCPRVVFRCFKALERFGDRVTGAAGPVFVALAVVLLSLGVFCFCKSCFPTSSLPSI